VLKTIERRWNLQPLTARDAAAVDVGGVLTLTAPRTDDPLSGVVAPTSGGTTPAAGRPSHLQEVYADLLARQLPAGVPIPAPRTEAEATRLLREGVQR
jgi:phospholipase C